MHSLNEASRKQHNHKTSEDYSTYAKHMHKTCKIMNSTCDMLIIRSFSCVFFFILIILLMICTITFLIVLVYARHMRLLSHQLDFER